MRGTNQPPKAILALLGGEEVRASIYISPIMVISKKHSDVIDSLSVGKVKTCKKLSTMDWKLHMRIADYSVLDMYEFSVNGALRAARGTSC
jgi:hypothetical protein